MARNLKIRDLTLRDGQQSSFATRMSQAQVDRCLPFYKDANFYAMEVWGGAVPDSVMRYLNENPWTRLETIYKAVGKVSKLTALSRGRNLFGYAPYPDDVIDGFCRNAIESGLGIMRIFDALNDVDNVKSTIKYVKQYGGIADCAVCYTVDPKYPEPSFMQRLMGKKRPQPVFTDAYFLDKAKQMAALGADMITIKDMSGLIPPRRVATLVKLFKKNISIPVDFHTHCTPGYGLASMLAAIVAGGFDGAATGLILAIDTQLILRPPLALLALATGLQQLAVAADKGLHPGLQRLGQRAGEHLPLAIHIGGGHGLAQGQAIGHKATVHAASGDKEAGRAGAQIEAIIPPLIAKQGKGQGTGSLRFSGMERSYLKTAALPAANLAVDGL